MIEKEEIESTNGLHVKVSKHGSPRIAQLLQKTIFGTEGKLRYRQREIAVRIRAQANVQFIEILKGKRVLGTVGMANRNVRNGDDSMHSLYVRYLSIAQPFKTRNRTSYRNQRNLKDKKSALRELIGNEITNHFELPFKENERDGAFYAYVESANINSRNLCMSLGFQPTRKIETLLFSRFNPSQKRSIQNLAEYEQDEVKGRISQFYKDHSFYFEDQIFNTGFYLVKKEKGKIIGGIRAIPVNWELVDYPGFEGWLMRDVLPYLPLTSRLFQPDAFKFLAFDYAWHIPDHEYLIPQLMSHSCSLFGINTGMIWGDMHSDLIKNLKSGNQLGFMHSVVGSVYADLMIRPINFVKDEIEEEVVLNEDEELAFPLKDDSIEEETASVSDESEFENLEEDSKAGINQESEEKNSADKATEDKEIDDKGNTDSLTDEEDSEPVKKDDLAALRDVLQRPIFVSALDMT